MDDRAFQFFFWVVTAGTAATIGWMFKLQGELSRLRLHIAEGYPSNADMAKLEEKIDKLVGKVDTAIERLTEIKAQHEAARGG